MRIFLCLLLLSTSVFSKNFILSQPRSGVNLTLCSLMQIVRRPVGSPRMDFHYVTNNRISVPFVSDKIFIYRDHSYSNLQKHIDRDTDKLILLSRNPKELFFKLYADFTGVFCNNEMYFLKNYMTKFSFFDGYPQERKMLLFYEDVIEDFDNTLLKILEFLQIDPQYFDSYLKNKEKNLQKIRKHYISQYKKQKKMLWDFFT